MHRKNTLGLRLCPCEPEPTKPTVWLLEIMISLLALFAQMLIFTQLSGFRQAQAAILLMFTGVCLCIFHGLLTRFQKEGWFFPLVLLGILLVCLLYRETLLVGYCCFHSQLGETLTAETGWVLPELEAPNGDEDKAIRLFSALCGAGMSSVACVLTAFAPCVLAVFLSATAMVGMYILGYTQDSVWLLAVLGTSTALVIYGIWKKKRTAAPILWGWGICAAVFCVLMVAMSGLHDWADSTGAQVRQAMHRYRYETEHTVLPEGDLSGAPSADEGIQPGLVVTMSHAEKMYLRGFAGCVFEENTWSPISTQALSRERELLYWINQSVFSLDAQFETASAPLELEKQTVSVQNIGGCSAYLYVPFCLCDGDYLCPENLNFDTVASDGSRSYSYTVVSGDMESVQLALDSLQQSGEMPGLRYRQAESAYRDFVYENYLSVPENVAALLSESWDVIGEEYEAEDGFVWKQARKCVQMFLDNYSGDGDSFLTNWEGTSYRYATLAVLTLRHFGIPARYAEGYVITEEMAESDAPLAVDSSRAAAWAEVYQDGIGWLPVDMPSGVEGAFRTNAQENEKTTEKDPLEEELFEDNSAKNNAFLVAVRVLLLLLLFLLLVFLILVCRRQYHRRKVERKFEHESAKEAVGWIFADTSLLLESMGLDRNNGSMCTICKPAGERFGEEYEKALICGIQLNYRALFSSQEATEADREVMIALRLDTLKKLKQETKFVRRFWLKWIRCLY